MCMGKKLGSLYEKGHSVQKEVYGQDEKTTRQKRVENRPNIDFVDVECWMLV